MFGVDVYFYQGDLFEFFIKEGKKVDIVVLNFFYILEGEMVDLLEIVCFYELLYVLIDGGDGLKFYKWFMEDILFVMKDKVFVVFEIGW